LWSVKYQPLSSIPYLLAETGQCCHERVMYLDPQQDLLPGPSISDLSARAGYAILTHVYDILSEPNFAQGHS
jgi:hypothetical protein